MANTGYSNLSAPQLTSGRLVAPPLGHIPPPPPTKPPPYSPFSSISISQSLEYSQNFMILGQYAQLYQKSAITPTDQSTNSSGSISPNKTVGEVTETQSKTSKATFSQSNNNNKLSSSLTFDNRSDGGNSSEEPATTSCEVKYKSDEGLKMKFSGGFAAKKRSNPSTIAVQLKPQVAIKKPKTDTTKLSVARAFGSDSDDEEEEMPRAAKLRMRNIGKDTPTSAGPNSFNKSAQGFTDQAAVFKKQFGV